MALTDLLTASYLAVFFQGALLAAVPLLLAAAGETVAERAGVLNLGIEGEMLLAGLAAYAATLASGSVLVGFAAGMATGLLCGLLMAVLCCGFGLNQIVVGLALTVGGMGLSDLLFDRWYLAANPQVPVPAALPLGPLANLPLVGPVLFQQPGVFWGALVLCALCARALRATQWGLRVRAAGQSPDALDRAGGSTLRTRSAAVLVGAAFAGLGGAYLALLGAGAFTKGLVGGLGFTAIIVAMLGNGHILWVALIALVYGVTVALGTALQLLDSSISSDVVHMLPAAVMMLILVVFARSIYIPPALAAPYRRGSR